MPTDALTPCSASMTAWLRAMLSPRPQCSLWMSSRRLCRVSAGQGIGEGYFLPSLPRCSSRMTTFT